MQDIDVLLRQHSLCHSVDIASYHHLLSEAPDSRCKALVLSSAISHAGDWLNVPSSSLGFHLHDQEFHVCLKYWMGLPMVEEGSHCPICLHAVDQFGDHQVGCGGNGEWIQHHDSIRHALFSAAQTAALAPRKEVPSLIPGTLSHPANIFLPIWQRGQPAALDVTVISTLQQCIVEGAAVTLGYALAVREERKRVAHATPCHAVGVNFIPLVMESLGGWSEEAATTISRIGFLLGQRLGLPLWKKNAVFLDPPSALSFSPFVGVFMTI